MLFLKLPEFACSPGLLERPWTHISCLSRLLPPAVSRGGLRPASCPFVKLITGSLGQEPEPWVGHASQAMLYLKRHAPYKSTATAAVSFLSLTSSVNLVECFFPSWKTFIHQNISQPELVLVRSRGLCEHAEQCTGLRSTEVHQQV